MHAGWRLHRLIPPATAMAGVGRRDHLHCRLYRRSGVDRVRYPTFYDDYWNLPALSGVRILGAPLEEHLFAFTLGIFWSPLFEAWRSERQTETARRRAETTRQNVSPLFTGV